MGIYQSIFLIFSFILSVRSCISFGSSGCSYPGATLGGRLVFSGQSGQDVAEPPAWISGRKLVFVTAGFAFRRSPGLGRGRIWIGQRGCRGDFCQRTLDGNLPCFADLVDKSSKTQLT
ncbi:hypothetical protein HOLleu_28427 [Holothuria leucospilota]|uniref:Secreted protein n=1 Tax=Holothuria leucospilota TaxID=206669 RepID=A0A9Q1BMD2_HOLLE|nr:hypothetical protein HOLleu_28427 [Holothuria leucospilota]